MTRLLRLPPVWMALYPDPMAVRRLAAGFEPSGSETAGASPPLVGQDRLPLEHLHARCHQLVGLLGGLPAGLGDDLGVALPVLALEGFPLVERLDGLRSPVVGFAYPVGFDTVLFDGLADATRCFEGELRGASAR